MSKRFRHGRSNKKPRNSQPEKVFVQTELLPFLHRIGCDVDIIESKAIFSPAAKRFLKGNAPPGFPDIVGNLPNGHSVYIEAKAPGKFNNLSDDQFVFLYKKIQANCFAVVVDNIQVLHRVLVHWSGLMQKGLFLDAKKFLLSKLPKTDCVTPIVHAIGSDFPQFPLIFGPISSLDDPA